MKIRNIIKGWAKILGILKITEDETAMSKRRLAICEKCPWAKVSGLITILNGNVNTVDTLICSKCTCPCKEKAIVKEEKCPINKW